MTERSESLANLFQALAAFQGEVQGVAKDGKGNYGHYTSLAAARSASAESLAKHGLSVVQLPEGDDLTTIVGHSSGEFIAATMNLHLPKQDPQGQGSAITYARRYAYMAALGLAPEDDDGASASKAVESEGRAPRRSSQGKPEPTIGLAPEAIRAALKGRCDALPPEHQKTLKTAWAAKGLPAVMNLTPDAFLVAEQLVTEWESTAGAAA